MATSKVKVQIFGNSYTIQGDASEAYITKLAKYLDNKMSEVHETVSNGNALQIAILAALNIADEYYQLKEIDNNSTVDIEKKTNALISMLEEGIIGDFLNREGNRIESLIR